MPSEMATAQVQKGVPWEEGRRFSTLLFGVKHDPSLNFRVQNGDTRRKLRWVIHLSRTRRQVQAGVLVAYSKSPRLPGEGYSACT